MENKHYDIIYACPELRTSKIYNRPHAGIAYLRSYLESKGFVTSYFRHNRIYSISEFTESLLQKKSLVYGFSVTDDTLSVFTEIAKAIKILIPKSIIIIGGAIAKFETAEFILKGKFVDGVIIGEGEYSTEEILKCIKAGEKINKKSIIPGLATWSETAEKVLYKKRTDFIDINSYPSPILSGLVPAEDMAELGLFSSRGCPYRCIYCSFSRVSEWKVRYYTEERFLLEFQTIIQTLGKEYADYEIPIWDDTFSLNSVRAKKLLRQMAVINVTGQKFWLQTRIDYIDEEFVELAKKAGIDHIGVGLESASPKVLKAIRKVRLNNFDEEGYIPERSYIDKFSKFIDWSNTHGICTTINVIFGLPEETFDDAIETLKLVERVRPKFYFHANVRLYTGVPLAQKYYKYGYSVEAPNFHGNTKKPPVNGKITKYNYDVSGLPKLPYRLFPLDLMSITGFVFDSLESSDAIIVDCDFKINEKDLSNLFFNNKIIIQKEITLVSGNTFANTYSSIKEFTNVNPEVLFQTISVGISNIEEFLEQLLLRYDSDEYLRYSDYADVFLEIKVENYIDYMILEKIVDALNTGGQLRLPNHITAIQFATCFLENACKWYSYCSSENSKRSYVDKKSNVYSCENGICLGNLEHKEGIDKYIAQIMVQRHCDVCIVKNNCSKCCSIPQEYVVSYCNIQRSKLKVSRFIRILDYCVKHVINPLDLTTFYTYHNEIYIAPDFGMSEVSFTLKIQNHFYFVISKDSIIIKKIGREIYYGLLSLWNKHNLDDYIIELTEKYDLSNSLIRKLITTINAIDRLRY